MKLEPIIGLEIHLQLKTKSKMFCPCKNGVEAPPNTAICPICMGHPGTLPQLNSAAVDMAIKAVLALNGTVNERSVFARKHYFYPDLPKGYQISQYDEPIGTGGWIDIETKKCKPSSPPLRPHPRPLLQGEGENATGRKPTKRMHLVRLHLEEDAAKLMHAPDMDASLVDYNRAGTPLAEIVTEPEFRSPEEAKLFLQELRELLRTLDISDADMEKGNMRCDANVSMRPLPLNPPSAKGGVGGVLYPKTEVKNINSFKAVERAIKHEIERQTALWNAETPPTVEETRGWNDEKQITESQRTKELAHDYRYFPEPDLPPLVVTKEEIDAARRSLPELPQAKRKRFAEEYAMDADDARIIVADSTLAEWTEHVISELRAWLEAIETESTATKQWEQNRKKLVRLTTGWITNKLLGVLKEREMTSENMKVTAENFAELITMLHDRRVNSTVAQRVLRAMVDTGVDPAQYLGEHGLTQIDDDAALEDIAARVISAHPDIVAKYKSGQASVLQFLIGRMMKETKGKANPETAATLLKKKME